MGHLIPLIEGGLTLILFELFLFRPTWLLFFIIALTVVVILGVAIPKKRFRSRGELFHCLPDPLIFVWSAIILLLFFENIYLRHFFSLGIAVYVFFYFENLFYYLSPKDGGRAGFLRMTNLMNVVTVFFLAAGLFGIKIFLQMPVWFLGAVFFVFSGGLFYGTMWIIKNNVKETFPFVLTLAVICAEFFGVICFLPLGFYVGGAILGIVYYVISGVIINFVENNTIPYKRYLAVGMILMSLILFSSRWV